MSRHIKISKGADIKLQGVAKRVVETAPLSDTYALKPTDFHGVTPKLVVRQGDKVKAGTTIFFDKYKEDVKYASPVSGEIVEIVRGARRKVLEIVIKPDAEITFEDFGSADPNALSGEEVKAKMLNGGVWPFVKQRPYDVVADPARAPKAIHVTAFDSAPLSPDFDFILAGKEEAFQAGLDALQKLTTGAVHLNMPESKEVRFDANELIEFTDAEGKATSIDYTTAAKMPAYQPASEALKAEEARRLKPSAMFTEAKNVEKNFFEGKHPAGNVGIQIHHIDPVNKGERVWTLNAQGVVAIGELFLTGKYNAKKIVALAGSEVKDAKHFELYSGAQLKSITNDNIVEGDNRFISGNVLTGTQVEEAGFVGFYDNLVSVIPEGKQMDFFGWALPMQPEKLSFSKALMSWLTPSKEYRLNTNSNGEARAFVVTGEYEKVFPMSIFPVYLLKSCLTEDIEKLEGLGIYEVAPEDMALCEFACTSKVEVQRILREGLDLVQKECD